MYARLISGAIECYKARDLPYGNFNGDISVRSIFWDIAMTRVVGIKSLGTKNH